jgi:hypothetical protein
MINDEVTETPLLFLLSSEGRGLGWIKILVSEI